MTRQTVWSVFFLDAQQTLTPLDEWRTIACNEGRVERVLVCLQDFRPPTLMRIVRRMKIDSNASVLGGSTGAIDD